MVFFEAFQHLVLSPGMGEPQLVTKAFENTKWRLHMEPDALKLLALWLFLGHWLALAHDFVSPGLAFRSPTPPSGSTISPSGTKGMP